MYHGSKWKCQTKATFTCFFVLTKCHPSFFSSMTKQHTHSQNDSTAFAITRSTTDHSKLTPVLVPILVNICFYPSDVVCIKSGQGEYRAEGIGNQHVLAWWDSQKWNDAFLYNDDDDAVCVVALPEGWYLLLFQVKWKCIQNVNRIQWYNSSSTIPCFQILIEATFKKKHDTIEHRRLAHAWIQGYLCLNVKALPAEAELLKDVNANGC